MAKDGGIKFSNTGRGGWGKVAAPPKKKNRL